MKIALLGYGKMGKAIEEVALSRGHKIVLKLDDLNHDINFNKADVAIDFSIPEAAFHNISQAINQNVPIVSGTTGWLDKIEDVFKLCKKKNGSFMYASNYSLGVNIFFALNSHLAKLIQPLNYDVSIIETHHLNKIDTPSGTSISLANQIIPKSNKTGWTLDEKQTDKLHILAKREENVAGIHQVIYNSDIDQIEIKHTAHSRLGFAQGAVLAAEFIAHKKGIFSMKDVLDLK